MSALLSFGSDCLLWKILFKSRLNNFRLISSYKNSICLPNTEFPHRINALKRVQRDREIEEKANFEALYQWQVKQCREKTFILHDGPPYANGDVHIGHAVNKILKDITVRNRLLCGDQVHYVPGWDCHGLPIELKVLKDDVGSVFVTDTLNLRRKAQKFSENAKAKQMEQFQKWGLLADWTNIYYTCHPDYVANQMRLFTALHERNLVYRDYKPVFWSPWNRTSLAEAELEYNPEHKSTSVYIKFPVTKYPDVICSKVGSEANIYLLIWTTTPWTLPANQGICYSENVNYCIAKLGKTGEMVIVATEMVPFLKGVLNSDLEILFEYTGNFLKEFFYAHPLFADKDYPLLSGQHVTMGKGTGLVHMAPNHGHEDYIAAQEHKIPLLPCIVDENGCYTLEAGNELAGSDVLTSGNNKVLELMKEYVVGLEDYVHSYPYDWRSNKPVIIRSSSQWFFDTAAIKDAAKLHLTNVEIIPDILKTQFMNQLEKSPQWCISRQRLWGVPIPAFYDEETKSPIVNNVIVDHLCKLLREKGIHFWWELTTDELLPQEIKERCNLSSSVFEKGTDIMDIWFDSGISWSEVLPDPKVADVCLEGVDQMRGWFYSSLLTSIATKGTAPYKKLFLHGFTTDADGHKMSKSKGNVMNPTDITDGSKVNKQMQPLGIDVLRWWVAAHACQHENIALKPNILEECSQNLSKIRNILKFLLGSLHGFDYATHRVDLCQTYPLDQHMVHLLNSFWKKVEESYNAMRYKNIAKDVIHFITNEVSSYYCHLIKDRLYCDASQSQSRRSCQTVLFLTFEVLSRCLAPITPHMAEEAYMYHPNQQLAKLGAFRKQWDVLDELGEIHFPASFLWAIEIRNAILKSEKRSSCMDATLYGGESLLHNMKKLKQYEETLCELFQVSTISIACDTQRKIFTGGQDDILVTGTINNSITGLDNEHFTVVLSESKGVVCPRCRRFAAKSTSSSLCPRCTEVMEQNSQCNVMGITLS